MDDATELVRKLGIRAGFLVLAMNAGPDTLARLKEGLPGGAHLMAELPSNRPADVILVWLTEKDDLFQLFQRLQDRITPDGAIWAVIPKRGVSKGTSVAFAQVQAAALKTNLVDNKVASFSDSEYGVRFVIRRERRGQ